MRKKWIFFLFIVYLFSSPFLNNQVASGFTVIIPEGKGIVVTPGGDPVFYTRWDLDQPDPGKVEDRKVLFRINKSGSDDLPLSNVIAAIKEAANSWQNVDGTMFKIEYAGTTDVRQFDPDDGVNTIFWAEKEPFFAPEALGLASITWDKETKVISDVDIAFNGSYVESWKIKWTDQDKQELQQKFFRQTFLANIQATATHELGHFVGLGHSNSPGALAMSIPAPTDSTLQRNLGPDDQAGVRFLYPERRFSAGPCTDPSRVSDPHCKRFYGEPNIVGASFSWDFGDGEWANGSAVDHTFPDNGGPYYVKFWVIYNGTTIAAPMMSFCHPSSYTVEGKVTTFINGSHLPVPGATAVLARGDGVNNQVMKTTVADKNGNYRFTDIPAGGPYYLYATMTGWKDLGGASLQLDGYMCCGTPGWQIRSMNLTMTRDVKIAMGPMAGPPGTTFTEWGTGFTPNSTATLHFLKPDGTEYPTRAQKMDSQGHFEITYTAPMNIPLGIYTWYAVDVSGAYSNWVRYEITPRAVPTIAMLPEAGPPGTTFTEWGSGFTPNSTATLHFLKADGSKYPNGSAKIDSKGDFVITYTAPKNKPPGRYEWWAVDVSGESSNHVFYEITR